jgi:rare lipoprotein A
MQTKLGAAFLLLIAGLLWTQPTFAATQKPKAQNKPKIKVVASPRNYRWCDFHACVEPVSIVGTASFYGKHYWQGRKMANGQPFDHRKLTAACWFLPLGAQVRVVNLLNGNSVVVEITDRGPAHHLHRIVDLSDAAAIVLDFKADGLTKVYVQVIQDTEPTAIATTLEEPADDSQLASIIGE